MAVIGKVIDGKYEILKQIGMSAIFLGITFFLGWKWNILQVLAKISGKQSGSGAGTKRADYIRFFGRWDKTDLHRAAWHRKDRKYTNE